MSHSATSILHATSTAIHRIDTRQLISTDCLCQRSHSTLLSTIPMSHDLQHVLGPLLPVQVGRMQVPFEQYGGSHWRLPAPHTRLIQSMSVVQTRPATRLAKMRTGERKRMVRIVVSDASVCDMRGLAPSLLYHTGRGLWWPCGTCMFGCVTGGCAGREACESAAARQRVIRRTETPPSVVEMQKLNRPSASGHEPAVLHVGV